MKRVFLIVLDSFGIGEAPDAAEYGDQGSNTLAACFRSGFLEVPNLKKLGLFNIDGVTCGTKESAPTGAFGRCREVSMGKDTTTGHWEIAGLVSQRAMPTYPHGFPEESFGNTRGLLGVRCCVTALFRHRRDPGLWVQAQKNGGLIVYTSADSVFQVAAHEETVPVEELYRCCRLARKLMTGEHGVGRIIARPFVGEPGSYVRTSNRHDFSLDPPGDTLLDRISAQPGLSMLSVGKIVDIFAGRGVTEAYRTENNAEGIERTVELTRKDFNGLCFVNLVDFDMIYGHRNDAKGYAQALSYFDRQLPRLLEGLGRRTF